MSKKKKKSRARSRQRVDRDRSIFELLSELEEALSQKRGRKAVALVKLICKHSDYDEAYVPKLVRAYEIRITEMMEVGQFKEADLFYQTIISAHQDWKNLFPLPLLIRKDFEAGSGSVLLRYGKDNRITGAIDEYIKTSLPDLYLAANHSSLPLEHPIKRQVCSIIEAWREVEGESETGAFSRMQQTVGRRSAFIDWRLLVTAIKAFYDKDDKLCLVCLAKISAESPAQKIALVLLSLIKRKTVRSAKESELRRKFAGPSLHSYLMEVDVLLEENNYRQAKNKFNEVFFAPELAEKNGLRREVGALFFYKLTSNNQAPPLNLQRARDFPHLVRLAAFWGGDDDIKMWETILETGGFSPLGRALINNRMAEIMLEEIPDLHQLSLFGIRKKELKEAKRNFLNEAVRFWERSVGNYPLTETFRQWHKHIPDTASLKEKETLLKRWLRDFPEDETPLIELVVSCRARKSHTKALSFFEKLDNLSGKNPAIERLRCLLQIDKAIDLLKKDHPDKSFYRLEELDYIGDPFLTTLRTVLLWIIDARGVTSGQEHDILNLNQPLIIRHILGRLDSYYHLKNIPSLPAGIQEQTAEPETMMENTRILIGQNDPVWKLGKIPIAEPVEAKAFLRTAAPVAALIDILEFIFSEDPDLSHPESNLIAWPLTANGIRRKDRNLAIFLAYRSLLLNWYLELYGGEWGRHYRKIEQRLIQCIYWAYKLALREGKAATITFVKQTFKEVGLPEQMLKEIESIDTIYSSARINRVINRELKDAFFPPTSMARRKRTIVNKGIKNHH